MNSVHVMFFLGGMLAAFILVLLEQNIIYACTVESMTLVEDQIVTVIRARFDLYGETLLDHTIMHSDKISQFSEEIRTGNPFACRISFFNPTGAITRPRNGTHFTTYASTDLILAAIISLVILMGFLCIDFIFCSAKTGKKRPQPEKQPTAHLEEDEVSRNIGLNSSQTVSESN